MDQGLDASVKLLSDGFSALAEEYKALAQQHEKLESRLAAAALQIESLRILLPADRASSFTELNEKGAEDLMFSGHNLDGWLQHMSDKGLTKGRGSLSTIHSAQLARFKLRSRARPGQRIMKRNDGVSSVGSYPQSRGTSQPPIPEEAPMEQDFTTLRTPGELGCPFYTRDREKSADHQSIAKLSLDPSTPPASGSYNMSPGRSKRASFVDPLKPDIKDVNPLSPAVSIDESTGVACPIRFLEQHSPEELAKYFDEHKHQLPRSHEVCVRRFQANAESIREIDAKYGNLVTMIQGLGKKHKAMLPEVPAPEKLAEVSEEQQAIRRVKDWAASVSEFPSQNDETARDGFDPNEADAVNDADIEDRLSHFERPLKEVRVGESPSRPWGVSIPSKYLERDNVSDASSSPVAAMPSMSSPGKASKTKQEEADTLPRAQDNHVLAAILANRRHGKPVAVVSATDAIPDPSDGQRKCPFDHKAPKREVTSSIKVERNISTAPSGRHSSRTAQSQTDEITQHGRSRLVNYGIAIVAHQHQLPPGGVENRGMLILGYHQDAARELLAAAPGFTK